MRAISVSAPGGPDRLHLTELPEPQPGPGEVLIRVRAAGVNRADLLQREGRYPPPPGASPLLGLEVAGEIAAVGPADQDGWQLGDPVCALVPGGGYAEYAVASGGSCLRVPEGVPLTDAAALPEAVFTVWANLFSSAAGQQAPASLARDELLLVQGGASGIGTMAIQMAAARGALVAATAGDDERCVRCRSLGAMFAVSYRGDWSAALREWCIGFSGEKIAGPARQRRGIDVILDMVAGAYFPHHLSLLAPGGRLAHISTQKGAEVSLDLRTVMHKRLVITGSTLRGRTAHQKRALREEIAREVWPLFGDSRLRPVVDTRLGIADAAEAHRRMEQGGHFGKFLLLL